MQCRPVLRPVVCLTVVLEEGESLTIREVLEQYPLDHRFDPETQQLVSHDTGTCELEAIAVSGVYYVVPRVAEKVTSGTTAEVVCGAPTPCAHGFHRCRGGLRKRPSS